MINDNQNNEDILSVIESIKSAASAKFDESFDISINLNVDPKHSDQIVRGVIEMPHGLGKKIKVAVFCPEGKLNEAKKSGADFYNADELIASIKAGKILFDICIATPDFMVRLAREQVAKILGPRGLMPNPKAHTVTNDIFAAVKSAKSGRIEYKTDKYGIVHASIGRVSFSSENLNDNLYKFIGALINSKPSVVKGRYIKSIYLSSTMGKSYDISRFYK